MITTEQFEQALSASIKAIKPRLEIGLDKVGELASTMAAAYVGEYQEGWPVLAEATIKSKAAAGYAVPDPLLRTGEMRDSIKHEVDPILLEVVVGSNDKRALFQELGTVHIPPRSFLGLALRNSLPFAAEIFGKIAVKVLMLER
jgi:hypothetical protein